MRWDRLEAQRLEFGLRLTALLSARTIPRVVADQGDRVGVVRQPFLNHHRNLADHFQHPSPIGQLTSSTDHPLGAHVRPLVTPAHLGATLDQHHAEAPIRIETMPHEGSIPRFEDVQRNHGVREEDGTQRKHREPPASHVPTLARNVGP